LAGGAPAALARAADSAAAAVAAEAGPAGFPGVALAPVPSLGHKSRSISSPISSSKCSLRASLIQSPRDNNNEKETKSPETGIRVEQRALTRETTARGGRPNLAGGKTYLGAPGAAAPRVWPRPVQAGDTGGAERIVIGGFGFAGREGGGEVEAKPRADGRRSSSIAGRQAGSQLQGPRIGGDYGKQKVYNPKILIS
jgi:hypothetical protein